MMTELSGQKLFEKFKHLYGLWQCYGGSAMPEYDNREAMMAGYNLEQLVKEHPEVASTIDELHLETPLHIVAKGVMFEPSVEKYLEWFSKAKPNESTPENPIQIIRANAMSSTSDREKYLRLLFAKGADVAIRDESGLTALHAAVKQVHHLDQSLIGDSPDIYRKRVTTWLDHQQHPIIQILLQRGSDPNTRDFSGWTPIHTAVARGQMGLVSMLENAGGDLLAKTRDGSTARDLADMLGYLSAYEWYYPASE